MNSFLAFFLGLLHGGITNTAEDLDVKELTNSLKDIEDLLSEFSDWS